MTLFLLAAAGLAAVALLVVLLPRRKSGGVSRNGANVSIYRHQLRELDADLAAGTLAQADYDRARREIEARLLEDVAAVARAGAGARQPRIRGAARHRNPRGRAGGVSYSSAARARCGRWTEQHAVTVQQIESMIARLAARLRENPDDVDGWKLLGRSYGALGRFPEAADAYAKAAVRAPRDAQLLADFADVLAMARGQSLQGEPEKLVLRALELDAQNLKALALAGTAAFERKDFAAAVRYWERMLPLVAADSEDARSIRASIAEAQSFLKPGGAAAALKGTVRLAPELKAKASPDDTVFVFARAAQGPPMPLAVKRATVRELPLAFTLDDSMAMAPNLQISGFPRVVVTARVSKSGSAAPQPGDLQGISAPVANDASSVNVVIDSVVK